MIDLHFLSADVEAVAACSSSGISGTGHDKHVVLAGSIEG
jgi:hypothetical protein